MRIELDKKYILNSDRLNVYITRISKAKKGKNIGELQETVFNGYHPNLRSCLVSFMSRSVNISKAENLDELIEKIERVESKIDKFCESIEINLREA